MTEGISRSPFASFIGRGAKGLTLAQLKILVTVIRCGHQVALPVISARLAEDYDLYFASNTIRYHLAMLCVHGLLKREKAPGEKRTYLYTIQPEALVGVQRMLLDFTETIDSALPLQPSEPLPSL